MGDTRKSAAYFQRAADLYQGDFLVDLLYEEWTEAKRSSLQETYIVLLDRLSHFWMEQGDFHRATELSKKILSLDPCLENTHRLLMTCSHKIGQQNLVARQYMECLAALDKEFGVEPAAQTKELYKKYCC